VRPTPIAKELDFLQRWLNETPTSDQVFATYLTAKVYRCTFIANWQRGNTEMAIGEPGNGPDAA
jgi:hypothetical protein